MFTASHKSYADRVIDLIDPENKYIDARLYRENCIQTPEGIFVKDLRVIANRNLDSLVLVDNAAYSFGYQLENGIPIVPFYDDQNDEELLHLIYYLD